MVSPSEASARSLMEGFARRTGLLGGGGESRYLWTDAFAVCNYLTFHHRSGDRQPLDLALRLVDRVHHVLGRHRPDSGGGWISGLSEWEGERHPTIAGLRIGKPLPERRPNEPADPRLEWERDGQYFHYLTRWMHALTRVASATGERSFLQQAIELARAAYDGFSHAHPGGGPRRLYWKMSTDLSRPLVASQGAHDPLDGLVTFTMLKSQARGVEPEVWPELAGAIEELRGACLGRSWRTDDALGIGGVLADACRLARLGAEKAPDGHLVEALLEDARVGLEAFTRSGTLRLRPSQRLAFRELGLALGLEALDALLALQVPLSRNARVYANQALEYRPIVDEVVTLWQTPDAQATEPWAAHRDINEVMLVSALVPDECLAV